MKAFISYSTKDKRFGAAVKSVFDEIGIESFLAHDDLHVSEEWKIRILSELKSCKIFVPLLSKAFKKSDWCNQETGLIVNRRGVLVIPLSIDGTIPYGFIAAIQGKRIPENNDYFALLIEPIIVRFPHAILPKLIERLAGATSFRNAEALMLPLVSHFDEFSNAEIESFVDACMGNKQIWDAADCKMRYIPQFLDMHCTRIPVAKLRQLQRLIQQ